jgi:hypothetical protein
MSFHFNNNEKTIIFILLAYTLMKYPFLAILSVVFAYLWIQREIKKIKNLERIKLIQNYKSILPNIYVDLNLFNFIVFIDSKFDFTNYMNKNGEIQQKNVSKLFIDFCNSVDNMCQIIKILKNGKNKYYQNIYIKYFYESLKNFHNLIYILPKDISFDDFNKYQKLLLKLLKLQIKNFSLNIDIPNSNSLIPESFS